MLQGSASGVRRRIPSDDTGGRGGGVGEGISEIFFKEGIPEIAAMCSDSGMPEANGGDRPCQQRLRTGERGHIGSPANYRINT